MKAVPTRRSYPRSSVLTGRNVITKTFRSDDFPSKDVRTERLSGNCSEGKKPFPFGGLLFPPHPRMQLILKRQERQVSPGRASAFQSEAPRQEPVIYLQINVLQAAMRDCARNVPANERVR